MGLPSSFIENEIKKWNCDLPEVPRKDRASEVNGPPVTLGVEWEFLVDPSTGPYGPFIKMPGDEHFVPSLSSATAHENKLHLYHISKALNDAGILAAAGPEVDFAMEKHGYAKARFPLLDHRLPLYERFKDYFIVRVDASVADDPLKMADKKWPSAEVSSPVMTLADLHKVDAAYGVLMGKFRIKTNLTYGVHVHVGNANRGFSPEWMRTTGAMCWAIAPLFDNFHPPSRGTCNTHTRGIRYYAGLAHDGKTLSVEGHHDDPANESVSYTFPIAPDCGIAYAVPPVWSGRPEMGYGRGPQAADTEDFAQHSEARIPAAIEKILLRDGKCPACPANPHMAWGGVKRLLESKSAFATLFMLRNAHALEGRMGYNFKNLRYQGHKDTKRPRTIEFRQHGGTTDLVAIKSWARVCVSIVEKCRPVRDPYANGVMNNPSAIDVMRRAVEGSLCLTRYDAYDFMADIGSNIAQQTYLRDRKDEANAVGLLVALPGDDVVDAGEQTHGQRYLEAFRPMFRALKGAV
ncbi:hypothetical protein SBRCBS47491_009505 [Sporothrix bragantina]|uniref:Amidoligase enzyme n=1 Tax=Sporothrix bragantina TaxID=671064 RepID=A0ABP0CWX5_9PEZI